MNPQIQVFDAFTGMSPWDQSRIIRFIHTHSPKASSEEVREALDYALKLKPSFGGFVVTLSLQGELKGVVVANNTGMGSYTPRTIFIYVCVQSNLPNVEQNLAALLEKSLEYADDDVALHLEAGHPALKVYQKLGFTSNYLELRFTKQSQPAPVR